MRTKTLLCAAILAVGAISTMAQSNVYSLNVVGYYNVTAPAGVKIILGNQLNTTNNSLPGIIPAPPQDTAFFYYNGGFATYVFQPDDFNNLVWQPDATGVDLKPGRGGFLISPVSTTITFVGEVKQGSLTNDLPAGTKVLRTSIVPQQGLVTTTLLLPADENDAFFQYRGGFTTYVYQRDDFNNLVWNPAEPTNNVGEAFMYIKDAGGTQTQWIRNFTVN